MLSLDHVWKRYILGERGGLLSALRHRDRRELWSLRDVSLRLEAGESVGLIGHNGAGKTTTLKLLAGITRPTRGRVQVQGRVASLINLGAGFHRELTGRENVYLNGVLLGLTRREVQQRYDQIVEFAGLEAFMDTPVKHYSSGMYARLAFSVATHVDPDVLLVDEVLSVGDAAFQDRSLRRMLAYRDAGAAVLFVSHNLSAVELVCQRVVWLEHGRVRMHGPASEVIRAYLDTVDVDDAGQSDREAAFTIERVEVLDAAGRPTRQLDGESPFAVRVTGVAERDLPEPVFVVSIRGDQGPLFAGNMHVDGNWPERMARGPFAVTCAFDCPRLMPGTYRVELKVKQNVRTNYYEPRALARFVVEGEREVPPGGAVPHGWRGDGIDVAPRQPSAPSLVVTS